MVNEFGCSWILATFGFVQHNVSVSILIVKDSQRLIQYAV
jgi:hypothetical protein